MKRFDDKFMLGAATSAHQVEGNNVNSDYWIMENLPASNFKEPSKDAVDHYNRYREDIKLLSDAGLNAYRFSIEWARIEPEKGKFDKNEIEHYREVLKCCYEYSVKPIVTLHHFSSPKWLISEGGWECEKTIEYFSRYCSYVVSELGELMPYICTINEANMGVQISRIMKEYIGKLEALKKKNADVQVGLNVEKPIDKFNRGLEEAFGIEADKVQTFLSPRTPEGDAIIIQCHVKAREVIKAINPNIKVGITMSLYDYQALPGGEKFIETMWHEDLLHYLPYLKEDDFLGVQNYTRKIFDANGKVDPGKDAKMTQMDNEKYPLSLAGVIRFTSKHWDKEIIVTENGIATSDDVERIEFIKEVLAGLYQCVNEGIPVTGYMYWSLFDNFEWQKGYDKQFGLVAVDRKTQTRYPKESLTVLGNIKKFGLSL
ncbi:MAG: glycoside hydrolase family 1 protein [Clostridiaceae bacterium]|nr:glycoside hydrolase family 1 protein [Clostridiaceae bacterium]